MSFFDELKRRNVFRVGAAYIVASWVLAQVVDLILGYVNAPEWVMLAFLLFVAVGFVAAVIVAWAYELTPDGIRRETDVDRSQSVVTDTGRKLDRIIITFLALAVVLLLGDRFLREPEVAQNSPSDSVAAERTSPIADDADQNDSSAAPTSNSIAVLPFVNMSTDADNEFFSDGISEEILNVLASIPELKVAARTSAFAYKGTNTNISDIAAELGVDHVLEGSVRKSGNQVRVTAQLIQAKDGFHMWSANYDRELTNIFAIQDEIAGSIAQALKVTLKLEAGESGNLTGTNSLEAYEHYLQGMQLWHLRTVPSLDQARKEFEASIALDPEFAKAYAGLALYWTVIDGYKDVDFRLANQNALDAADRALALDPENVEALTAKASVLGFQGSFDESGRLFRKAMTLNPSFATAYQWYASRLAGMGDPFRGIETYRKAWSLDPRSRIIGYNLAYRLLVVGELEEASTIMDDVLAFAPEFPDGLDGMMILQLVGGDCEAAQEYAVRLAQALNKKNADFDAVRDICQQGDPDLRRQTFEAILSRTTYNFAAQDDPGLFYEADLITLLIHYGYLDLLWPFIENKVVGNGGWPQWIRNFRTPNGILAQCNPRFEAMVQRDGLPPLRDPITCPQ